MSDIALLKDATNVPAVATTGNILASMLPTSAIPAGRSVGLYWETYGFGPMDSVAIEVRVQRVTPQGGLRRLGQLIGVSGDLNTPVAIRWSESRLSSTSRLIVDGNVPIVGHTLQLNVSTLARGEYTVEITTRGGRNVVVHGWRELRIE